MSYKVLLHPKAARSLEKLDTPLKERIKKSLRELRSSPETKSERIKPSGFWRLRVGDYCAIFEIDQKGGRVIVLFIGHRRDVYDDFSRLLE
ncbi:MAG: type II toxin-antitoxin system RelE/ParE family toxin [Candidatus Bathyarchaeia archaeon]